MDTRVENLRAEPNLLRDETDNDEIDLLALWKVIWQRKWNIIGLVFAVMMLITLVVFSVTPIYQAAATMMIEQKGARVLSIEEVYGVDGSSREYLQTQFELLKSRTLAENVVRKLKLHQHSEFDPAQQESPLIDVSGLLESLASMEFLPGTTPSDLEEDAPPTEAEIISDVTEAFMERIEIEPVGRSQLVRIKVEMTDPATAAAAANALAEGFIEGQLSARMEMTLSATTWMNERLSELRVNLREAEGRLQAFRDQEGIVDVGGIKTVSANELSATNESMIEARRRRAEAESEYRQVEEMRDQGWERIASIPAVLSNPLIQKFKEKEATARARVDELSSRYGPRHPVMEAAMSDLNAAKASLKVQVEQIVASIERNYQLAVANEKSLRSSVDENIQQIQGISRKEFRVRELQREVDTSRTLLDAFMTRLKETSATSDMDTVNARIVDRAAVPDEPIKPKKALIVVLSGMLAGIFGVSLAFLMNALNNTFKSTDDIENKLNLPVLGVVPLTQDSDRKAMAHMFSENKDRSFAESMRTIRTSLLLSSLDDAHQVFVVTSSIPAEGKSTVSANLAYAFGQTEKVLLIEADMRRPTMAKSFDFPAGTPGLANLVAGTADLPKTIHTVDGIDIMTAGIVPPNPLELISTKRFAQAIKVIRERYTRIVIDSPPIHAVSDALLLSTFADSVIYVVKSDSTACTLAEKGVGRLLQGSAPVTGIVLNQVDIEKAKKHGYEYGGYYDHYGYTSESKA